MEEWRFLFSDDVCFMGNLNLTTVLSQTLDMDEVSEIPSKDSPYIHL